MEKHIFNFDTETEYQALIPYKRPHVALTKDDNVVHYDPKDNDTTDTNRQDSYSVAEAEAADVLFVKEDGSFVLRRYVDTWKDDETPIGVVAVPGNHNLYGDNSIGVLALKLGSLVTPETGTLDVEKIRHGGNAATFTGVTQYTGFGGFGYMSNNEPDENFTYSTAEAVDGGRIPVKKDDWGTWDKKCESLTDLGAYYYNASSKQYYLASPYLSDGSLNDMYLKNEEYQYDSNIKGGRNALSDIHGLENSTYFITVHEKKQATWKTDSSISIGSASSSYEQPQVIVCTKYHTEGTKMQDWYLPAEGELGYVAARYGSINEALANIITKYGEDVACIIGTTDMYYTSTQYPGYVYYVGPSAGAAFRRSKSDPNPLTSRPFMRYSESE